jgi:CubicO group peptidase (beta-lactamase class C family)
MCVQTALLAFLASANGAAPTEPLRRAAPPSEDQVERLDRLFSESVSAGGSYLLAYRNADRVVARGYGSLDCSGRVPMPSDALFDSGSLTKLFTAAAVFKLVQAGRLKLDDRVGDFFSAMPPDKRAITIAQLLAHRSGMPNLVGRNGRTLSQREWSIEGFDYAPLSRAQLLRRISAAVLEYPPGTNEAYSNTGFTMLAAVIEAASGEPYERYVRQAVFVPAGMRNTGYLLMEHGSLRITQQCRDGRNWGDPLSRGVWKTGVSWNLIGAGGMMTTLTDLQRFTAAIEEGPLFRPDIRQRYQQMTYGTSARCRTSSAALGGSNGMTRSLILHLPRRNEAMVAVATRREWGLPDEGAMLKVLCPDR